MPSYITLYFYSLKLIVNRLIVIVGRVFSNGPANLGSLIGRVIAKTV